MRPALGIAAALLATAAPDGVALSGGRALYARGRALRLGNAGGIRTLARAPRGKTLGGFDLGPGRAVWAVGDPGGFQRIMLRRL